jgi:hypothetical protein
VSDALLVRGLQRLADLRCDAKGFVDRERTRRNLLVERLAVYQFEDQEWCAVRLFNPVDGADVWVIERGEYLGFAPESGGARRVGGKSGRKHFDGDVASELRIPCAVDLAHASDAENRAEFVGAEFRTERKHGPPDLHGRRKSVQSMRTDGL